MHTLMHRFYVTASYILHPLCIPGLILLSLLTGLTIQNYSYTEKQQKQESCTGSSLTDLLEEA